MISRGWEAGVKALDRDAASVVAAGLDASQASATLLQFVECLLGHTLTARNDAF